jgi:hypothetical protein
MMIIRQRKERLDRVKMSLEYRNYYIPLIGFKPGF